MLNVRIELRGEELYCTDLNGAVGASVRRLTAETLSSLQDWARRYDGAVASRQSAVLPAIGRKIADLLTTGDAWLDRSLQGAGEIASRSSSPTAPSSPRPWTSSGAPT
jgi:hypothetical protein